MVILRRACRKGSAANSARVVGARASAEAGKGKPAIAATSAKVCPGPTKCKLISRPLGPDSKDPHRSQTDHIHSGTRVTLVKDHLPFAKTDHAGQLHQPGK